ncbi:MAG: hypothetical protein ACFCUM_05825 [Bacteroidales bacterium]
MESHSSIIRPAELTEADKNNLFQLHVQYYDQVVESVFMKDLSEKDWIIIIKDGQGELQGFSTIQLIWLKIGQKDHLYLFSGDTIIREAARNFHGLSGAFIHFMYALIENHHHVPIHWFLITKGFRTYRFLPLYFREYYPVRNKVVPGYYQEVLDTVAFYKFGNNYNPGAHLICYDHEKDRLKPKHALVPDGRLRNPEIEFFLAKNPFYHKGDELTCITDISMSNFNPLVERVRKGTLVNFNWERS